MAFSVPSRSMLAVRPSSSPGVLAAAAVVAAIFAGTPFIIAGSIDRYGTSQGVSALISTLQVGAFMLTNFLAGRRLHPSAAQVRYSLIALTALNLLSAAAPSFALLSVTRLLAGIPMGLITWLSWSTSAEDGRRRGEVAMMGPLAAAIAAPLIGLASGVGLSEIYLFMALLTALCLLAPVEVLTERPRTVRNPIGAPVVKLILLALVLSTGAGSSVFVYAKVISNERIGLSTLGFSLALSVNALSGIPAAKFAGRRRFPGLWLVVIGLCGLAVVFGRSSVVLYLALAFWGLAFWIFVPEAFSILADLSVFPSDRVGDAQAAMSLGRVLGPTLGAIVVSTSGFGLLGVLAFALLAVSAVLVEFVATDHRRVVV